MTIAVGFNCSDGIVVAADSEISTNTNRMDGQKLWCYQFPRDTDQPPTLKVVLAGAGDAGYLRATADAIDRALRPEMTLDDARDAIQAVIDKVHLRRIYPYSTDAYLRPSIRLLIGLVTSKGRRLLSTTQMAIAPVPTAEALGIGEELAQFLIKQSSDGALDNATAVSLSIQILMHARTHVPGCGGPSNVLVLRGLDDATGFVTQQTITAHESFFRQFDEAIRPVFFGGVDRRLSDTEFGVRVDALAISLELMRREQFPREITLHAQPGPLGLTGGTPSLIFRLPTKPTNPTGE
jgi:hypothetical protein